MISTPALPPSAFVSYSHDSPAHCDRVLALANQLRADGIDVRLDRYVAHPPEGWPRWSERQAVESTFVLVVCTPSYRERFERSRPDGAGKGAQWEGMIVQQLLYEAGGRNDRIVPVWFEDGSEDDVPLSLRAYARYRLPSEHELLYRRLTGQPLDPAPPLGSLKVMPPRPTSLGEPSVATGSRGSASAPASPSGRALTDHELVDELARVLADEGQARLVAQRAGLPPSMLPAFRTSLVFWTHVIDAARNGAIAGGVAAVAAAAARLFPGNAVLRRYLA